MAEKRVYFIFLALLALAVAGCTNTPTTSTTTPFCGGNEGVEVKFVDGSPPTEVFDNNQFPFDITLSILNKGEHAIGSGESKIELSGISNVDFGGPSYSKIVNEKIVGQHKDQNGNCISGDPVLVSFGLPPEEPFKYKHSLPGNTQFPLRVDMCYKYSTNSTIQFCVQKDLPRPGQEPTCKVNEAKTVSNSGSPLQIENFKQNPGGEGKIAFTFDIVHKGTGTIHSGQLCDTNFPSRNKVHVKVSTRAGAISCTNLNGGSEGDAMLIETDKKFMRVINCIMDTSQIQRGEREFETPLNIELGFNYKQHDLTNVLVKHLG